MSSLSRRLNSLSQGTGFEFSPGVLQELRLAELGIVSMEPREARCGDFVELKVEVNGDAALTEQSHHPTRNLYLVGVDGRVCRDVMVVNEMRLSETLSLIHLKIAPDAAPQQIFVHLEITAGGHVCGISYGHTSRPFSIWAKRD